jgi:hypothetical protein
MRADTCEDFRKRVSALSERLAETIDDSRAEIPVGLITAALLETIGYYVGLCLPAARQELMRKFRKYLLDDLESEIELSAQLHTEILSERMTHEGMALALAQRCT